LTAISQVFEKLRQRKEGALIGYVMAGDPEPNCTPLVAEALIRGGVDVLELGVPFSDPIADGPTIQAAGVRALKAGTTPRMVLEMAHKVRLKHDVPIVLMTYYNPIFKMEVERFFGLAKDCLVDGVIVPDVPIEESDELRWSAEKFGVDTIFLAAPSTSDARLERIVECSSGFLYLVSHFGVTGAKAVLDSSTGSLVKRISRVVRGRVPLAVGFGVSKVEHVRSILEAGADGVIVGSVFVNTVAKNVDCPEKMVKELEVCARLLKEATQR
jgi:tryptophan synthase alpha chain